MEVLQQQKTDLKMHDEIVNLPDQYLMSGKLNPQNPNLSIRQVFMEKVETDFRTTGLKIEHMLVTLEDCSKVTVSLFDIEYMILSLLTNNSLVKDENLAPGYDSFMGEFLADHSDNNKYGEVHTGDAYKDACKRFCGSKGKYTPLALILFGDKIHKKGLSINQKKVLPKTQKRKKDGR